MRIAIFTNNYLPNPYGVATSVETFRRDFERLGHTVYIFAPEFPGYTEKDDHVFRYPSLDIEIKFRFPLPFSHSWKIGRMLKKLDLDIIHSQHPNLLGAAAARWAKKKKIPLVFTWHTLYDCYVHFVPMVPKKMASGYVIGNAVRYANRADAVIVPTDSIIPNLRTWGVTNKKIFPVATGVIEKDFAGAFREEIRKKYGIAEDELVLLSTHRLTQEKNIDFLFRALLPILKNSRVKFLVVGDGDLAPTFKNFCKENDISEKVFFAGAVIRSEIKNYYAAADIFVHASKSETQGMVVTEAMYMKLPIVALNATGVKSLVINSGNGFLVEEEKFTKAVETLVSDSELRQKFGEVSMQIARKKFTSEICAEEMLEIYNEIRTTNSF